MFNRDKNGFTIIEVTLVMAISGLLLLIGFFGQGEIRRQAQFTDAMERIVSQLEAIQSEASRAAANTANGCGALAPGRNANCILFGKSVNFKPSDDFFTVNTVIGDRADAAGSPLERTVAVANPRLLTEPVLMTPVVSTIDLSWGVKACAPSPTGASGIPNIIFTRHSGNGKAQTYILSSAAVESESSYTSANIREHKFYFQGQGNELAIITVNNNNADNTVFLEFLGKADCATFTP